MDSNKYIKCPACGGEILSTLIKCVYCQSIIKENAEKDFTNARYNTISFCGGTYVGELLNNLPYGQGTLTLPNGTKYICMWKDGKPNGKGKIIKSDGSKYEGNLKDGKRHGLGKFSHLDGILLEGEWENGKFIRPIARTNYFETHINKSHDTNTKTPIWSNWWVWAILIVLFLMIMITFRGSSLREEKIALDGVQLLQKDLLAPKSLNLYEVIVIITDEPNKPKKMESGLIHIVYIKYSAMNRAGGFSSGKAMVLYFADGSNNLMSSTHSYHPTFNLIESGIKDNSLPWVAIDVNKLQRKIE